MTRARRELVDPETTPYYHCIARCVRRAYLCGQDSFSGKSYEHRKGWVLERLEALAAVFAVDICAYAVMSNHYHLVVRLDRERARAWSEQDVMDRWARLFSVPVLVTRYRADETVTAAEAEQARALIAEWRERLCDLSWFMRGLNEHLARRANEEDGCKGRFWEGRFKSQALLDEAAVLTCMSYVDLNPVRAGVAQTPEASDFTSIRQRIAEYAGSGGNHPPDRHESQGPRLMDLDGTSAGDHPNHIAFTFEDYLQLVDWAGRAIREDKRGAIPGRLPPILARLNLSPEHYLRHVRRGGRSHHVAALGHVDRLREAAERLGRRFLKGLGQARRLYQMPA
ncbi:transposase [Thioalkalivibrio thiocyanodenitrificans]|uniref:transposase n=1 Tax=Thioalkalivibrio thiocyanodenitrificans TaxID=243063 RepID=UPI000370B12A|nr:transposase [Thioalkalivibrio thiocyanodenitrificans]